MIKLWTLLLLFYFTGTVAGVAQQPADTSSYNVIWDTPSRNSQGTMPLGNGDVGMNVWVEENGDLLFYLSKTDAWSEMGQLLKLSRLRIALSPNPFVKGRYFKQELRLEQGEILIHAGDQKKPMIIRLWVDALNPVVQVDMESKVSFSASVSIEPWRREDKTTARLGEYPESDYAQDNNADQSLLFVSKDVVVPGRKNSLLWYHRNSRSNWSYNMNNQALSSFRDSTIDPLLYRTFGAQVDGVGLYSRNDTSLSTLKPVNKISLRVYAHTAVTGTAGEWTRQVDTLMAAVRQLTDRQRYRTHLAWWAAFWKHHFIHVSGRDMEVRNVTTTVSQGYALQRFVTACGGRGAYPIKFNGSIFTVDTYHLDGNRGGLDADFRLWGGSYWFQNTRLPYWPMLQAGDLDMMKPFFGMYFDALPLRKAATRKYFGHDGAHFPETMNFWGTYNNGDYGVNRKGVPDGFVMNKYIRYYWSGGLELSLMMLDYYDFSQNPSFVRDTLSPFVSEILTFYDKHYDRDQHGKMIITPSMALETYQSAINPLPVIAGIKAVTQRMLLLPENLVDPGNRKTWHRMQQEVPDIPVKMHKGQEVLAPADYYWHLANTENPEMYAVFPYRLFGVGKENQALGLRTYDARVNTQNGGWQQNSIQAAMLGKATEAADMISESYAKPDPLQRFKAFFGPNYDWTPDQDHGNVANTALQKMLLQYEGDRILLLPAWPANWDVHAKLHAPKNTVVEFKVEKGVLNIIQVIPESRRKDIEMMFRQ